LLFRWPQYHGCYNTMKKRKKKIVSQIFTCFSQIRIQQYESGAPLKPQISSGVSPDFSMNLELHCNFRYQVGCLQISVWIWSSTETSDIKWGVSIFRIWTSRVYTTDHSQTEMPSKYRFVSQRLWSSGGLKFLHDLNVRKDNFMLTQQKLKNYIN
jgi:hypothetical protein